MALVVKNPPAKARDTGSTPGSGRSPGGGKSNPLQYCWLENSTNRAAWQDPCVQGVTKNRTRLKRPRDTAQRRQAAQPHWARPLKGRARLRQAGRVQDPETGRGCQNKKKEAQSSFRKIRNTHEQFLRAPLGHTEQAWSPEHEPPNSR